MFRRVMSSICCFAICFTLFTLNVKAEGYYEVPSNSSFKSYMDYESITCKTSSQYKLQSFCETNVNGLRVVNGMYTVAIGTAFNADIGTIVKVELSSGVVLTCVVGDIKADAHTDSNNMQMTENGNIVEFIVDSDILNKDARITGDISAISGMGGYIDSVTVTDENVFCMVTNKYYDEIIECYFINFSNGTTVQNVCVSESEYNTLDVGDSYIFSCN